MELSGEPLKDLEYFEQNLPYRDAIDLTLVYLGERPACLVMDPGEEEVRRIRKFCKKLGFYFLVKESVEYSDLSKTGVFVTKEKDRLNVLEDTNGRFYGFSDRKVGEFLGFPDEDVEYFAENIENGPLESETREKALELASEKVISREDVKFVELVTYVARPSEESVLQAVKRGKDYRDALLEFDTETGSDLGRRLLNRYIRGTIS
mgnify:FL=1